jgi:hypothetical protein
MIKIETFINDRAINSKGYSCYQLVINNLEKRESWMMEIDKDIIIHPTTKKIKKMIDKIIKFSKHIYA